MGTHLPPGPDEDRSAWRRVWRDGIAPLLSLRGLRALGSACESDDPALVQRATAVRAEEDSDGVCGACVVGYALWRGDGLRSWLDLQAAFGGIVLGLQPRFAPHEMAGFFGWADETPRAEMLAALLPEVRREIARREAGAPRLSPGSTMSDDEVVALAGD